MDSSDVVIAGGGVIGTAIAWRAALAGLAVTVVDPQRGDAATEVAAGMLAPASEAVFGEQDLIALNLHAVGRFSSFAAELEAATGMTVGLRTEGTLSVAFDKGDHDRLARLTAFRRQLGLGTQEVDARGCRELEPFLAPGVQGGVLAVGDLSVDNRRYAAALRAAAAAAGATALRGEVAEVAADGAGALVTLRSGEVLAARAAVLAAGWRSGRLGGLPGYLAHAFRPVKGQILRLRHPAGMPPVATRTIRAIVKGTDVYLVPRADGELVVGATQDERGDDQVTAGAVHDLLHDAMSVLPAVSELTFAEAAAGLRPGSADNGPVVGWLEEERGGGILVAAGHFRNGIMLSAATADAVAALLAGAPPAPAWRPFTPARLRPAGLSPDGQGTSALAAARERA